MTMASTISSNNFFLFLKSPL